MNQVYLSGKCGKDAKSGITKNGHRWANVSMATSKKIKEEWISTWHTVTAWGKQADQLAQMMKGDHIMVIGELTYEDYEKDGVKKTYAKVLAREVYTAAVAVAIEQAKMLESGERDITPEDFGRDEIY